MSYRFLTLVLLALSLPAVADESEKKPEREQDRTEGVTYSGVGLSRVDPKIDTAGLQFDTPINLDATLGFRIPTIQWFGIELNISSTVIPGQVTETTCSPPSGGGGGGGLPLPGGGSGGSGGQSCTTRDAGDFGGQSVGAFVVLRSPGAFYAQGRVGYRYLNYNADALREKRTGSAYGLGVGYRWNPQTGSGVELGYNRFNDRLQAIGFQFNYGFGRRD
ncbi:Outer membrane protein beta-barrel domain-containing protein [Fontimonas thermophila]|uniref:Outer membrane protein beta-barrel domain-containing protein n=1 Tax=Fontimonas thermophila TaxID=1076937 RepID=A0A1I2H1W4_9GAMM|nr:outer membrane beta-barrel protein [Fontimonas thermophila]SFF22711.1 Outer membrane protein beta-barrel domain-containing protein [Fontimonas thermophila]